MVEWHLEGMMATRLRPEDSLPDAAQQAVLGREAAGLRVQDRKVDGGNALLRCRGTTPAVLLTHRK